MSGFVEDFMMVDDARPGHHQRTMPSPAAGALATAAQMAADHPWLGVVRNHETAYPRYALLNWPQALGHATAPIEPAGETDQLGLTRISCLGLIFIWP
jgi:hypothetical protein